MKAILIITAIMLFSCSTSHEVKNEKQETIDLPANNVEPEAELTLEQEAALDALNTLQTSTDQKNRLYSTFANIDQPFYPEDTSFVITQSELLSFMKQFVSQHCQNLDEAKQVELAEASVLAQEKYTVLYCSDVSFGQSFEYGLPLSGTWVIPNVLGRRDVIIVW